MKAAISIDDAKTNDAGTPAPEWLAELQSLTSSSRATDDFEYRVEHSRDRLPFGRFCHRSKQLTVGLPSAVVEPADIDEVARVVKFANDHKLPIIPYGSGSGVLGGTVSMGDEIIVGLGRIDRLIEIDEVNCVAHVEAGMNGGAFEAALNERGFTCGHYPQSLNMSTVGGWAACRGSGQSSSRYGNIENMIVGMKVVLPDGELLKVRHVPRRSVGPSLIEMFIGSEGTLGMIVELTFRIWRQPACEICQVIVFPTLQHGLDALRNVMQAELRPSIVRLYDEAESLRWSDGKLSVETHPIMCTLAFSGRQAVAEAEASGAIEICEERGALLVDDAPFQKWKKIRFESYSDEYVNAGGFYDTIEVAAPWSALPGMYTEIRAAVTTKYPAVHLNAHWSHVYSDGACMYMTVKIPAMPDDDGFSIHANIWEIVTRLCLDMGGTTSHHHGIGYFRSKWFVEELNAGHDVLMKLKEALDPDQILNPGKLGMKQRASP
jgi:alkyldihydroxyacetonephosphate synthase